MKKALSVLLVLTMVLTLTACGSAKTYSRGTTEGNTYRSEFFGITGSLDANEWVFASDDEIAEIMGSTQNMVSEDYAKVLEESGTVTEFYAMSTNGTDTVNMAVENLSLLYSTVLNEESYLENSKDSLVGALESMGMTITNSEVSTMNFAGKTHHCLDIAGDFMGLAVYEKIVVVKEGNYMAVICACTWMENTTGEILEQFSAA